MKNNKFIDELVLFIFVILLGSVAVLNLCQTDRPTVSEIENRNLATMPDFTWDTFLSGEYFADIADFISDTFIGRENLVSLSKKLDTFKSLSTIYEREGMTVIIDPNAGQGNEDDISDDFSLPEFSLPPLPPEESEVSEESDVSGEEPVIIPVKLSADSATFTAGATYLLSATVGEGYENLVWSVTGDAGISIVVNDDGSVTVKGDSAGKATVTATVNKDGEAFSAECIITVNAVVIEGPTEEAPDFLPSGLIIYKGAAYSQSFFSSTYAPRYAAIYERYAQMFPDTRMNVVIAPLATITITDPEVSSKISNQAAILDKMQAAIVGDVNFVNLKNVYLEHAEEYLFFKSDHHWTHRGAYYAYSEFIKSVGMTPTPIEDFDVEIITDKYIGSMYGYTGDERVKSFYDTIEAYMPNKALTMTIFRNDGKSSTHNFCINTGIKGYTAFISGDHPYMVINVPENPQDKSILVIKDSYGNAFVPYLTEHYGNIIVIDPRHVDMNIYDEFKDYGLTDIVFMVNTSSGNTPAWYNYLVKLID